MKDVALATASIGLVKTDTPSFGDIVLFRKNGRADHIAVYLKNGDFIHCDGEGVRILNLAYYDRKGEFWKWPQ